MLQEEEILLIVYFLAVILIVMVFGMFFFTSFQKSKNKLIQEKLKAELVYKAEIEKSKVEIQEQTLKNVAWELHDNIGQLLSVVNMQLSILRKKDEKPSKHHLAEVQSLVQQTVQEVRSLSKTLNNETVNLIGLIKSIEIELERIERLKLSKTKLEIKGVQKPIEEQDIIILFRIVQEFLANSIKHAKASKIDVNLEYSENKLYLTVRDDGCGFDAGKIYESSGIRNMKSRAQLIKAHLELMSQNNQGTELKLIYNLNDKK